MKKALLIVNILLVAAMALAACTPGKPPAPRGDEDVLYLNIIWHQHQPLYYKNEDGVYTRPWVRVHATKDYYDMAAVVAEYPKVHVTFNLTPVLLRQLDDFINGAKDLYWVKAEIPADQLSDADKRFILERFFDVNWTKIISRYPRYQELLDKRGGADAKSIDAAMKSFTEQDFRDLQIWFNLAWFDPDFLAEEPLKGLVEKGRDFAESDKKILFDKALQVMKETIPLHKKLQDSGQIEVITTPYAHPILPLIVDSNLAAIGNPGAELPTRFTYGQDANAHLKISVDMYTEKFGQPPKGLWPGEGSVAQAIVPFVINADYQWMATGEPVLAKSLGIDSFTRDPKDTVKEADLLYRPYYVKNSSGDKLAVFFRDGVISDKLGFTYSGVPGTTAAKDLMQRLENIRTRLKEEGATGPHLVSIILDGENAWEYYDNDGKEFFHEMYRLLSESETIKTVTPSQYLEWFPEQRELDNLFAAAWFQPNFDTWIGEVEENMAWEYLGRVRADLAKFDVSKVRSASAEAIALAQDFMYLAEGSDWFWWYGADQDSGQDSYFDEGFRALLRGVYESLGEPVPTFVNVPIIQKRAVNAATPLGGISSPVVDGKFSSGEWDLAATYPAEDASPSTGFAYALDAKNLYVRVNTGESLTVIEKVGLYLNVPRSAAYYPFAKVEAGAPEILLNNTASHLYEWHGSGGLAGYTATETGWRSSKPVGNAASGDSGFEFSIPLTEFGDLEAGDEIRLMVVLQPANQQLPADGPGQVIIPDLGLSTLIFEIEDPEDDDHGPGSYTYPTDNVFTAGAFDLKSFRVSYDDKNLIFKIGFYGPVPNPWGSPNNLAIQTLDVYVDKDPGAGTGARLLLPGRNAALSKGNGWEYAIWAEGWTPQVLAPDASTLEPKQVTEASFKILVDPAARTVTLRVPRAVFGDGDPTQWGYAAVVLGQEGFPSAGVWRVRDVNTKAEQWRFGGAPADVNHTRILDVIWQKGKTPTQEEMLSIYPASNADIASLKADDFAQLELLLP